MKDPRDLRFLPASPGALARSIGALLLATAPLAGVVRAQLPNDNICTATGVGDGISFHSNVGALAPALGGCEILNSDVWFWYQPGLSGGTRTFSTCGPSGTLDDTVLEVFESATDCFGALPLACNDDSCGLRSSVTVNCIPLNVYFIRVADYGGLLNVDQGSFPLTITGPPPPNDECVGAIEVFAPGSPTGYTNRFATNSGSVANFCGVSYNSDVWFKWVATCTGSATFGTCSEPLPGFGVDPLSDTVLQVLSGTCGGLVGLGQNCDDDGCGTNGLKSSVSVPVTAGTTYFIRVAAAGSGPAGSADWGDFRLSIDCCAGSFLSIPTGCGNAPPLLASGTPCPGGTVSYNFGGPVTFPLIWIGAPTSVPLCPPSPCSIGASLGIVLPAGGFSAAIPYDPALSGLTLAVQAAALGSSGGCGPPNFGIAFTVSNTIVTTIG